MKNNKIIIGFDEVGRGSIAGPVVVACIIGNIHINIPSDIVIRDSKKMTKNQKNKANNFIKNNYIYGIGKVSAPDIDKYGIVDSVKKAALLAFQQIEKNIRTIDFQIINDGREVWFKNGQAYEKAEDKYQEIAMASIIAKVYRDKLMSDLDDKYSIWKFSSHVGYGTKYHRQMIVKYGLLDNIHRKSFCRRFSL